jgi:predicted amidohydrolase YtcJ
MVRTTGDLVQVGEHYLKSGFVTGYGNERLRLGAYKSLMDGSGSGGSAAMREPYPNDSANFGILHMTQAELDGYVMRGHSAGYQVGVHAIGDRAVEMTVNSFENASSTPPAKATVTASSIADFWIAIL